MSSLRLPLYVKRPIKNPKKRALEVTIFIFYIALLIYRVTLLSSHGTVWLLAFLCESWFTFNWFLNLNLRWSPVEYNTHLEHLFLQFPELPPLDMFVTTADTKLEPPIITINTVLSLLAADYPAGKLACYVSDDEASLITYYSLVQASKFAKSWVPFCKRHNVETRSPSAFFALSSHQTTSGASLEFADEYIEMKRKYEELRKGIDDAVESCNLLRSMPDAEVFKDFTRENHPSVIKVILGRDQVKDVPCLIYLSREKRPKCPHHYKAGAMNVLTRVSGVLTNAPFMLNVDCDMFMNNPKTILHAMCLLLGGDSEESGFVQFPQCFHVIIKNDPFGNHFRLGQEVLGYGMAGIQGPLYQGTGCIHRRKIIYGQYPPCPTINQPAKDKPKKVTVLNKLGSSTELAEAASHILSGLDAEESPWRSLEKAMEVTRCTYEINTAWGDEVGWMYGSPVEDVLTGLKIHSMGWRSAFLNLDPPAFLGCAPTDGPTSLIQRKRWAAGLFEIMLHRRGPFLALFTKAIQFRQFLAYLFVLLLSLRSIPEIIYSLLPAYCLLANTSFLPQVTKVDIIVISAAFICDNLYTLAEYKAYGMTARTWWNTQRMSKIVTATSFLSGFLWVLFKHLGLSEIKFEITRKDDTSSVSHANSGNKGRFTFDSSPIFIPGTTLVLVHIVALVAGSYWTLSGHGVKVGEIVCSTWLLLCFLPFVKGLFGRGRYGIPWGIIIKATALTFLFIKVCTHFS